MESAIRTIKFRLDNLVWSAELRDLRGFKLFGVRALRMLYVVIRDLIGGELNLRAMSLVYTTLLSVVPLLAVSFTVLKAFGVHKEIAPRLQRFLEPLGPKGMELAEDVTGFVENVQVGLLGAVGVTLLIYTSISLMHKIEAAVNFVWHIETLRSFGRRVSNFLIVILLGPVLVVTALAVTADLMGTTEAFLKQEMADYGLVHTLINGVKEWGQALLPYGLVWITFSFIYWTVPNTRVRFSAAAVGGIVASVLWQTTSWGFGAFIASSARYATIYKGFAVLILTLIWLYLNWLMLLIGAQVAFYVQNPHFLTRKPLRLALSNRLKEGLALTIMYLVGYHHYHDQPPWNIQTLCDRLDLPYEPVQSVLNLLARQGYLELTGDDPPGYLPARDTEKIEIRELLSSVRQAEESRFLNEDCVQAPAEVRDLAARLQQSIDDTLAKTTIRDLIPDRAGPGPKDVLGPTTTARGA